MPRRSHIPIPHKLQQLKAQQIYERRIAKGKNGNPEGDWEAARRYLSRYPQVAKTWNRNGIWRIITFPFWLSYKLPQLFANKATRPFALDVVKTIISAASLIATIIAAAGLYFNILDARQDREDARQDRQLTQERLVTDRFTKAVGQLGNSKETVIIGGIYSLERIAKDSPKDQWTIMEVLTAFVRQNSEEKEKTLNKLAPPVQRQVQAALTVIGRRNPEQDYTVDENPKANTKRLNLSSSHIVRAYFYDANLRSVYLHHANLRGAYFRSANLVNANLFSAYLYGGNFSDADLTGANLRFADLERAFLDGANLRSANLNDVKNLTNEQIKSACFWDKAIYTDAQWNDTEEKWILVDEKANQKKIEVIRQDQFSDPTNAPDCSRWK